MQVLNNKNTSLIYKYLLQMMVFNFSVAVHFFDNISSSCTDKRNAAQTQLVFNSDCHWLVRVQKYVLSGYNQKNPVNRPSSFQEAMVGRVGLEYDA